MSSSATAQAVFSMPSFDDLKPYGFLLATFVLSSYLLYQWALPKPLPGIPYNVESSRRILGDIPELLKEFNSPGRTFMSFTRKQIDKHDSPIIQLFVRPLGKPFIVLSDFRESQDILMRRKEFDRSLFLEDLFQGVAPNHHIMLRTNSVWKAHRRLLQDLMSPSFLHDVAGPVIHSNVENLIKVWSLKAGIAENRPFSATHDIYAAALDAVFGFAFGKDFKYSATGPNVKLLEGLSAEDIEKLRATSDGDDDVPLDFPEPSPDAAVSATFNLALALEEINGKPLSKLVWKFITSRKAHFSRALKQRDEYIYRELELAVQRMEKDVAVHSAVDHMMQREKKLAEKDGRKPEYISPVMADETFGFVIAGHETTSTSVAWSLKILADNPRPQTLLREFLESIHSDALKENRSPTIEDITSSNIPYLDAVMEELLRCGGTIPGVDRQALCDTEILGHHIPKGTVVLMSGTGHSMLRPGFEIEETKRSESCQVAKTEGRYREWDHDDIGMFKPERWLDNSKFDSSAGPQLAFGLGTRGCYGKKLAYLELRILLTMIVWHFELLPCPKEVSGYDAVAGVTYKPKQCFIRLRKVR